MMIVVVSSSGEIAFRFAANIRGRINFDGLGIFGTMDGYAMP
jgi:hypothetical protein